MSLFRRPDGELTVRFYDDPRQTLEAALVSVTYTFRTGGTDRIARDFGLYVGKVIYCLGPGMPAERLRLILMSTLAAGVTKSTNVMRGDGYAMNWAACGGSPMKVCSAKFYADRPPVTKFSFGGEDYYPPMSCLAFLQYLIDNLSDDDLAAFSAAARP